MRNRTVVQKKSYPWKQLLISMLSQSKTNNTTILLLSAPQMPQIISKALLAMVLVSLWWWNWQLVFATGVGISLMWLIYKMSGKQWRKLWQNITRVITGYNRKLFWAVGGGSIGGIITYMNTAIWTDTENHWLAVGSILQGFGTFLTLMLVGWHISKQSSEGQTAKFEHLITDLTASDSLKRFIAIRQLTNLARKQVLNREQRRQLIEYFQFMLNQPQEQSIQDALLDSLDILGFDVSFPQAKTVQTPINIKQSVSENV